MERITDLPNIGPEMERQLNSVNVFTYEDLKIKGSKKVWLDIQKIDSSACLNRLYGLEGAIRGIRWHNLPNEVKEDLKHFYNEHRISKN